MSEFVESVKSVEAYLESARERNEAMGRNDAARSLAENGALLVKVREHILHLEALTTALPTDLGNIQDLPKELLDELSIVKTDDLEDQIVTVINAYDGAASLDQILVGLFRKFNVVQKRRFLQNKLYRMSMVWGVEGKKGVYTTTQPEVSQVEEKATDYGGYGSDDPEDIPF